MRVLAPRPILFWLGAGAILFLALHLLNSILLPFVASLAIAYFLAPAVDRLERWHLRRGLAAATILLLFLSFLTLVAMLLVPLLELQISELVNRLPAVVEEARAWIEHLVHLAEERLQPEDAQRLRDLVGQWVSATVGWAIQLLQSVLTSSIALANVLSLMLITPIVAFFWLRDWNRLVARIDSWLPRNRVAVVREQARLADAALAGFMHGQILVSTILGTYYAVALSIVGLDFSIVMGLLIGILSFVPFLGVTIGFAVTMGLALLQFKAWTPIVLVGVVFVAGQTVESNVLSPMLVGERVNLHPVWVIFALLAFGSLFGFLGVLVALPAAAVTGVLVRFALSRYLESPLYDPGGDP